MITGFQPVKADTKMAEVQEKTSASTITKLNSALNPMEKEEDQESTQKRWRTQIMPFQCICKFLQGKKTNDKRISTGKSRCNRL